MTTSLPDIKPNDRFNKSQASAVLDISRTTLDRLIATREIKARLRKRPHSDRKAIFFLGSDIIRYFNKQA